MFKAIGVCFRRGVEVVGQMRTRARQALGLRIVAGRDLRIFPDDTFVVSYPRSGNTWMRFLLTNLTCTHEPTTFLNLEARMPEIYFHYDPYLRGIPRPRLIKSHE